MKVTKTISLDLDVVYRLQKIKNYSKLINDLLIEHFNKLDEVYKRGVNNG